MIDIAVMRLLSRQGDVNALVENYGQIVVDECHHVGAASFDAILKRINARFDLGLAATPICRDGQQSIIFMRCGPIRHTAARPVGAPHDLEVAPRTWFTRIDVPTTAAYPTVAICDQLEVSTDNVPQMIPCAKGAARTHDWADGKGRRALQERAERAQHKR